MRANDAAGNLSAWMYGPTFASGRTQQTSTAVRYSGTWTSANSSAASGGSLKYSTSSGASASYSFTGSSIAWVASKGPNRGSADVYIDGVLKATVSLHSTSYLNQRIVYAFNWSLNGTHTIRIVNRATSGHPRIDIDAFVRLAQS